MSKNNITYLTDVALITCVVNSGKSDVILKAARDAGALTGALSHHAKGYGVRERLGILGVAIETEKEVVTIVVSSEQQDTVSNSICQAGKFHLPGNGYLYITPLDKAAVYIPESLLDGPGDKT